MGSSPRRRAHRRAALVAYLQMAPAAEVIDACRRCEDGSAEEDGGAESSSPSPFGDAAQDALHRCVTHPIATSHPPDGEYVARLLKLATLEAERSGRELSDRVGDLVARTFTRRRDGADEAGWCHKTYVYRHPTSDAERRPDGDDDGNDKEDDDDDDDDDIRDAPSVSFRMHRNMFEGGTGCHEWLAGIYLAELALTRPTLFENRRVVELGSGVGIAATVMARGGRARDGRDGRRAGRPSRLVLTDADAGALANLERNLAANDVRVERYESNDERHIQRRVERRPRLFGAYRAAELGRFGRRLFRRRLESTGRRPRRRVRRVVRSAQRDAAAERVRAPPRGRGRRVGTPGDRPRGRRVGTPAAARAASRPPRFGSRRRSRCSNASPPSGGSRRGT